MAEDLVSGGGLPPDLAGGADAPLDTASGPGGFPDRSGGPDVVNGAGLSPDGLREHPVGAVSVWLLAVPGAGEWARTGPRHLDPAEHERMRAFRREVDRVRYGFAHSALRAVLALCTGREAAALRFVREDCPGCGGPHGRPALDGAGPAFSLSHGGDLVAIAVAAQAVGVDVEPGPRPQTVTEVATALHPGERAEIGAATGEEGRAAAFARLWTRKEAYLKGVGTGIGVDLAADDLRTAPPGWRVVDLPVVAGHAAAVAVRTPSPCVVTVRPAPAPWAGRDVLADRFPPHG
ncbi:4'-phosphopantetheinyl transferase superfamily protein [Streptomyces sp. NPDC049954]|uniref:4'-phosphopantetheinyl transferase family protein n=1 Tax=Streptomyces sp. NPDC049954 TaxID=3155779 RepID=UPI003412BF54